MQSRPSVVVHMGANQHTVTVEKHTTYDLNNMSRKERSTFHREFMNAFRQTLKQKNKE